MGDKAGNLFRVELLGVRDAQGRFARATAELVRARRDELRALGRRVVEIMRDEAPIRTGRLRKGITSRTTENLGNLRITVGSAADYTIYVVRGRGPVEAKLAKALRFEPGPPGSGFIFRRRVGPAKANDFPKRGFARLASEGEPDRTVRRIARRVESAYTMR